MGKADCQTQEFVEHGRLEKVSAEHRLKTHWNTSIKYFKTWQWHSSLAHLKIRTGNRFNFRKLSKQFSIILVSSFNWWGLSGKVVDSHKGLCYKQDQFVYLEPAATEPVWPGLSAVDAVFQAARVAKENAPVTGVEAKIARASVYLYSYSGYSGPFWNGL